MAATDHRYDFYRGTCIVLGDGHRYIQFCRIHLWRILPRVLKMRKILIQMFTEVDTSRLMPYMEIGSGGLFGRGIGGSLRKYGYLTQADNDYILAVIIEETGIFGLGILSLLYGLLIYRFFYYAFKTNEFTYKTVLVGSSAYLFIHFVLNVGGVSGLIPSTGVPLLFISSGGSSLMAAFITIGLCQQCIFPNSVKGDEIECVSYPVNLALESWSAWME